MAFITYLFQEFLNINNSMYFLIVFSLILLITLGIRNKNTIKTTDAITSTTLLLEEEKNEIKIFYSTQTGTSKLFAQKLYQEFSSESKFSSNNITILDIVDYDTDDFLSESAICILIISTYNVEGPLDWFVKWLEDTRYDFRVSKQSLSNMKYTVFGLGDSAYGDDQFCTQPRNIDKWLGQLDQEKSFEEWKISMVNSLLDSSYSTSNQDYVDSDKDMGKLAPQIKAARKSKDVQNISYNSDDIKAQKKVVKEVREMVSPMLHKSLTKQGYKIVGTHSGVKICRWTKAALRGRGFCYKNSFYGIQSWRHHTNPVGTEWRWKVDEPQMIFEGAMANHYQMIKQMKGVPGVRADRFQEAFKIQHCALSLVGEPIFYPYINEFIELLHGKHISSFLVTNAQFPDKIAELKPVTQLYVSVDASTKESLKKIDRPLFKDFWERFLDSLDELSRKGQRTVYRLTLVKDYNTEEIENYIELIERGRPDFIEVKGVTYCGYSGSSNLTMANEVIEFVEKISQKLGNVYEIAAEHSHSCSILIANTKFKINGRWHTWINYDKFFELIEKGKEFTIKDSISDMMLI
ncbi:9024_t:CDS:10 [Entrophospora sp. SA101]|nr:9024_t:CDS:10 [Entrophospora sp. SA101]